ncbi:H-NS histone family protein, partial [Burkholderia vietnamiensis]|nr:H-NS histone family protein [Burkholderia vietnamiensis]
MDQKSPGYLALIAQRESLDAQIIAARKAEREVAIGQIKALMKEFDLSGKRLSLAVSLFTRAWGTMVMAWWSPCRSREIVSAFGDRGHDPS